MESTFKPHRISLNEARVGDNLHWKRQGIFAFILAHLIHWLKERDWDMWDWHLTPVVFVGQPAEIQQWLSQLNLPPLPFPTLSGRFTVIIDAIFPRVKLSLAEDKAKRRQCRAYRVTEIEPAQDKNDTVVKAHVGRPYDWKVYFLTAAAKLLRPFIDVPRLVDRSFDCWEVDWNALNMWGFDPQVGTDFDYDYPWLCDLRRAYGEMPLKRR